MSHTRGRVLIFQWSSSYRKTYTHHSALPSPWWRWWGFLSSYVTRLVSSYVSYQKCFLYHDVTGQSHFHRAQSQAADDVNTESKWWIFVRWRLVRHLVISLSITPNSLWWVALKCKTSISYHHLYCSRIYLILYFPTGSNFQNSPREVVLEISLNMENNDPWTCF